MKKLFIAERDAGSPFAMSQIDATPFIQVAAPKGHRKRFKKHLRVFLGATVDITTDKRVNRWAGKSLSIGLTLDQIVEFAAKHGFKPERSKRKHS